MGDRHKPYHDTEVLREDEVRWIELDGHHLWALNWAASPNGAILKFDRRTDTWVEYTKGRTTTLLRNPVYHWNSSAGGGGRRCLVRYGGWRRAAIQQSLGYMDALHKVIWATGALRDTDRA